ncbi:MAG: HRDC domain-containing protein [Gemmatimonadaceae bacterium]|nr:HRDC domain-containing protein [Gemmatimonadaceae bacterium]
MPFAPHYLDTPDAVDKFLDGIEATRAIAIDTEGASFHRFVDRIYLLQLSTATQTAVIDPLPIGTPAPLGRLLEDRGVEVVLHDADYDLRLLRQDYGWQVTNVFDTRVAAQLLGIRSFGLAALLEQFFAIKLDKRHQRADWSMRPLTADMLDYAAQDTHHLLALRDRLHDLLAQKERLAWAREEFQRLEGTRWDPEPETDGFLRIKGARDLTRRELALLRELVPWRDGIARTLDRATFRVASNDVLLELSRQAPRTREAAMRVKGMPRNLTEARTTELLDAIARGLAVPDAELPRFPRAPRWDRDPDFDDRVGRLKGARDAVALGLDLDPGVLCSRDRLEAIARARPTSLEALIDLPGMRRWQAEVLGDPLLRALGSGKAMPATAPGKTLGESPYRDT